MTEAELKADNETFRERIRFANGAIDVFNVHRDILADNERLRGLIKQAEGSSWHKECPWCEASIEEAEPHDGTCPAFTENGEVK